MYYQHFGLNGPPFQFTPSPSMLYMSQTHREGMAALEWGLMYESSGFSLLAGESGTGKTTLIASLLSRQYQRLHLAYVTNPRLDFTDILRLILSQLGVEAAELSKGQMLDELGIFLGSLRPGERVVIILDEAQGLSDDALEELRLLSNYGRPGENQMQLILAGQPELLRRLMAHHLRQFNERIGARTLLVPLDATETLEYIDYRLRARNGSAAKIFNRKALKYIVAQSAGIPRRVNVLCHNSMLLAYGAGAKQVSLKMAREAVTDYQDLFASATKASSAENPRPRTRWRFRWAASLSAIAAAITGLLLIVLLALSSFWSKHNQTVATPSPAPGQVREPVMMPRSASLTPSADSQDDSTTEIYVPDYGTPADSEPKASSSTASSSSKLAAKQPGVVRFAKRRMRDGEE